jgi:hypothetical protein
MKSRHRDKQRNIGHFSSKSLILIHQKSFVSTTMPLPTRAIPIWLKIFPVQRERNILHILFQIFFPGDLDGTFLSPASSLWQPGAIH